MKKIINGKVYDTETATQIGTWDNGHCDYDQVIETLYQKRTGEYFLHGEGGARSRYATHQPIIGWSSGEIISPLTYEQAQDWAAEHLDDNEYEEAFGEIKEDDGSEALHVTSVPSHLMEQVRRIANKEGVSVKDTVIKALETLAKDKL